LWTPQMCICLYTSNLLSLKQQQAHEAFKPQKQDPR
jgi:hypothetical protein